MAPSLPLKLLSNAVVGPYPLSHRVVHAPMTRLRADRDDSPSQMMQRYYEQRASRGGLLIVESTHPSLDSRGYLGAPGIYTDAHRDAWKPIVEAVHAKGGVIFLQLGHDGRQSHSDLSNGKPPIAPSVVPFETNAFTQDGWVPASPHRAVDKDELPALIESYRQSAQRALDAGFDGPIIAAGGFDRGGAEAIVQSGAADLVAFGRHFSANPDLPERLRHDWPLTPYVRDAFWGGTAQDYSDFPEYGAEAEAR